MGRHGLGGGWMGHQGLGDAGDVFNCYPSGDNPASTLVAASRLALTVCVRE